MKWTNNIKVKIDERISHLTNKLCTNQHRNCLSSPNVKNALHNIHKDFVNVLIYKSTTNITLVLKRFYASVITRELGFNNNSSIDTYNKAGGLSGNDITNKNITDLKIKFGVDKIPIENHQLPNMCCMRKMHKNPIEARFIIASLKSSIKHLARTITSVFGLLFRHIKTNNDKCRYFIGVNTFWVVQNNKPIIDAMNWLNKRRKATSVSHFDLSTLYIKLPHNKLLMVLNSLIDFSFDEGESKCVTVSNYGACCVENIKDNVIRLKKKEIKDAVAYLLFTCYFTVGPKISCQIIGIHMGYDPAPLFANLLLYFYESKKMNKLNKNDLIKARKPCNIFRIIDDLNSINDGGKFESSYWNIYAKELQLGKENM